MDTCPVYEAEAFRSMAFIWTRCTCFANDCDISPTEELPGRKAVEDSRDGLRPGEVCYYDDDFLSQLAPDFACAVEPARAAGDDFNAHAADPPVRPGCGQLVQRTNACDHAQAQTALGSGRVARSFAPAPQPRTHLRGVGQAQVPTKMRKSRRSYGAPPGA